MASNVAPPKNTGGGGFTFEDDVCASLLASMLVGDVAFGVDSGPPIRIDFQTRADGWFLDDVLVTTSRGGVRHRFALSVKSNAQFTAASAPSDFVEASWEQLLHIASTVFDPKFDFMGLVTAPLSSAAAHSVSGLVQKVIANDPALFPSRIATPNWASADERDLFASFACPASLGQTTSDVDIARLLQRLRFIQHDFGAVAAQSESRALELCRRAVHSQTLADAQTLWSVLRELAAELRPQAGSLTLFDLVDRLRVRIALADYPDHSGDWLTLDARSRREAGLVRASIADRVHLPRDEHVAALLQSISAEGQVALLGASGVGKSALAKTVFEQRTSSGSRTLWLDASSLVRDADFGAFEASLQLRHPLAEILAMEGGSEPLVVLDGLDRVYEDVSLRAVATLIRSVSGRPQATRWRVVAACQSQEWPRVLEGLQRAGAPVAPWRIHDVPALELADIRPVRDAVPSLGRLLLQPRVGSLLTNLKLLDLVVRRLDSGTHIDSSGWVGESSVAEWFWTAEVDRGSDRIARGQFVRTLAQVQADKLITSVAVDDLAATSLIAAQSLMKDQLVVESPGDRLAFAHDLYGDWARLRVLLNHINDLGDFLRTRHESPLWHRALRLLGIHLLERPDGVAHWRMLMASFSNGSMTVVRDVLLEAPAFAINWGPLLQRVFPDLIAGNGELLCRLLTRFMAFATVPDDRMQEIARSVGMDANAARAAYRRPHWPYWLDILSVLHTHRAEAVRVAAPEVARVVQMWLEFAPLGAVRRREAAEIAVMLGQLAVDLPSAYRARDGRERFYKCALMAGSEFPDDTALVARAAAQRVARPRSSDDGVTAPRPLSRSFLGPVIMRGPWPDGPLARVDESFQNVVLDTGAIQHLYRERPAVAREVILATLIEAPREEHWGGGGLRERELDLVPRHKWLPAFYTHGPFLTCLRSNFGEGLELIMSLVDFATERVHERAERARNGRRAGAGAYGHIEDQLDSAVAASSEHVLHLLKEGPNVMTFRGDGAVYSWSSGLGNPPYTVQSSLMALEQYFYLRLDAQEDISEEISLVVARSRSVAALGVLCDIGKRQTSLFGGPLRALLSGPEIYSWEISKMVHARSRLMLSAFGQGEALRTLAQQFHRLEHRKRDLRHIAVELLFQSASMKAFFESARSWWRNRKASGEPLIEMANQLEVSLDPANYEMREDPTHGWVVVNTVLERMQVDSAPAHQAMSDRMLVMGFPIECRTILDERPIQTHAQLDEIWSRWRRVRELAETRPEVVDDEDGLGDMYVDAIAGGLAVLLRHDDWISVDATRRQELEIVLESIASGDGAQRRRFGSEHDASTWTWDCFIADATATLWAGQVRDIRWRRRVAELVFADKYATVRVLFARCGEVRKELGDDFGRLRRLAFDWAHVRDHVDVLRSAQYVVPSLDEELLGRLQAEVLTWVEQAVSSFVDGSLALPPVEWSKFGEASRFVEVRDLRGPRPDYRPFDFHLVRCAHEWMPSPDDANTPKDRAEVVQFWRVALDVAVARPRADLQRHDHLFPDEDEVWVLENVAAALLQLRPSENPDGFWTTIMDLRGEAHDWSERFLTALHRRALAAAVPPPTYAPLLRKIAKHAFSQSVNGDRRWPWHEEVWDALIGIDYWLSDLWSGRHAHHVLANWDIVSLWMDFAPQEARRLGKFATWLSRPAAALIRLRVLPWFLVQLQPRKGGPLQRESDVSEHLAALLNVVWDQDRRSLQASPESLAAFRGLLAWLVERQDPGGLELQGRIGGLA